MKWFGGSRSKEDAVGAVQGIPPRPKLNYESVRYSLIFHFTDREDHGEAHERGYITSVSWKDYSAWETEHLNPLLWCSNLFFSRVGDWRASGETKKYVEKCVNTGLWIGAEFIAPHRLTGCTIIRVSKTEERAL